MGRSEEVEDSTVELRTQGLYLQCDCEAQSAPSARMVEVGRGVYSCV